MEQLTQLEKALLSELARIGEGCVQSGIEQEQLLGELSQQVVQLSSALEKTIHRVSALEVRMNELSDLLASGNNSTSQLINQVNTLIRQQQG